MAEGQITSPILGNFSDLGKMFMDGTARINAIKQEVAKERFALNSALTESIDEIGATGITEWDKVVHSGAQQFRSVVAQAIRDNKAGLISRSDVSSLVSNFQTQAGMLANTTKLYTEKADAIQKRIEAGTESPKALADYNTAWFQDNSMTEYNIKGDNGKMRANQKLVQSKIINNQLHFVSTKEILVPKLVGGVEQLDDNDEVIMETKTITQAMPAGSFLDTNIKGAPAFDVDQKVKDFKSTIGAQVTFIDPETKQPVDNQFTTTIRQPNGDLVTTSIIAPESFTTMVNLMENRLREINPTTAATIIFDELGARSLFHDDSPGVRPEAEWKEDFGIFEDKGVYEGKTMPKFFDVNGDAIKFTSDPLVLEMSDDGVSVASTEQVELAKAFMREKYLRSMNITQEQFVNRKKIASSGKPDPTLSQIVKTEYQVNGVMRPIDNKYLRQTIGLGSLLVANLTQRYQTAKGEMATGGSYTPPSFQPQDGGAPSNYNYTPASVQALLSEDPKNKRTLVGASFTGEAIKLLDKEIKLSTVHGTPLDTINGIAISTDDEGSGNTVVILTGNSVYRQSETGFKIQQGGANDSSVDTQTSIEQNETGVAVLNNNQLPSVYEELYKIPEFREIMKKRGFIGISAKYRENVGTEAAPVYKEKAGQFIDAFESYANYLEGL